jgi:hypothetical protein
METDAARQAGWPVKWINGWLNKSPPLGKHTEGRTMKKSAKRKSNLMPTGCIPSLDGSLVPVAGYTSTGSMRCTCCAKDAPVLTGSIRLQREAQSVPVLFLTCADCTASFKTSGAFQERFLRKLYREGPAITPAVAEALPRLRGVDFRPVGAGAVVAKTQAAEVPPNATTH